MRRIIQVSAENDVNKNVNAHSAAIKWEICNENFAQNEKKNFIFELLLFFVFYKNDSSPFLTKHKAFDE